VTTFLSYGHKYLSAAHANGSDSYVAPKLVNQNEVFVLHDSYPQSCLAVRGVLDRQASEAARRGHNRAAAFASNPTSEPTSQQRLTFTAANGKVRFAINVKKDKPGLLCVHKKMWLLRPMSENEAAALNQGMNWERRIVRAVTVRTREQKQRPRTACLSAAPLCGDDLKRRQT
jgi:hypothetical protein